MKVFYSSGGFLSDELRGFYKSDISYVKTKQLIRKKDVKINGKRVSSDLQTSCGDEITVYYDGEARELKVLYADENILAAYKPKGENYEDFAKRVKAEYHTAEPAHRLDTNTDGIIIFSLNAKAEEELYAAFKNRTVKKFYTAEVYGRPKKSAGVFKAYLFKDAKAAKADISPTYKKGYKEIITAYRTLEERENSTVLEVELITGRTHQIRAHLAYIGNFIIGDGKYGKESINKKFGARSQRLTASRIIFAFSGGTLSYLDKKEIKL